MNLKLIMALLACCQASSAWAQVDLAPYLKEEPYEKLKISPSGEYLATTAALEDRTALVVMRRSDGTVTAKVVGKRDSVVHDFWWANDERVVVSLAQKFGSRDQPSLLGALHAVNADGSKARLIASPYPTEEGTRIGNTGAPTPRFTLLADTLDLDERNVLVKTVPAISEDPYTRAELLDVYSGRMTTVATVPVRNGNFFADAQGTVRVATGANIDNALRLYYRDSRDQEWRLVNDEAKSRRRETPLGFSADGKTVYLQIDQPSGPDRISAWTPADGRYQELIQDPVVDPYQVLYDLDNRTPIGASFMSDKVRNRFFDEQHPTARLYRSLEKAFGDHAFFITSVTADRKLAVIYAWSDRNSGDYFLFDTVNKQASRMMGRREWMAPEDAAPTRQVSFKARDGLPIHGYLTTPKDAPAGPLPLVILPHGGPFQVFDKWEFDDDAHILADAGYAVLRVNYRGSDNYGIAFARAGAQEWGGRMQDDLTDATRWAIEQKITAPGRICIYGGSYGGYASLMGVAREPSLYQCAVGYVGVYDLRDWHRQTANSGRSNKTWVGQWLGDPKTLAARSPVTLAAQIKVPVFLAAGGKDEIAPISQSKDMEKALKAANVPVETLYFPTEGHGFYTQEHQREFYTRLLAFLSQHLGGKQAK